MIALRVGIVALLVVSVTACGYRTEPDRGWVRTTGEPPPAVALELFENQTFRRGLEIRLSREIADELRGRGARAAVDRKDARILLSGRILRADEQVLSEDRDDDVRESSFLVTVEVVLRDLATEKEIGTYSLTERAPFSPRAGRVATLEQAQAEALRDLAERIVYRLETEAARRPE